VKVEDWVTKWRDGRWLPGLAAALCWPPSGERQLPPAPLPNNESERYIALMAYRHRGLVADVRAVDLVKQAKAFFESEQAVIALVGGTRAYFLAEVGAGFDSLPREHSFCGYTIHDRTPLVVEDAQRDVRFADNPYVAGPPFLRFYAGAPLVDRDGYCLGTFCLVGLQPRSLSPAELSRLVELSGQAMQLIELQKTLSVLYQAYSLEQAMPSPARVTAVPAARIGARS
jgi:GAF domain-containing protein